MQCHILVSRHWNDVNWYYFRNLYLVHCIWWIVVLYYSLKNIYRFRFVIFVFFNLICLIITNNKNDKEYSNVYLVHLPYWYLWCLYRCTSYFDVGPVFMIETTIVMLWLMCSHSVWYIIGTSDMSTMLTVGMQYKNPTKRVDLV